MTDSQSLRDYSLQLTGYSDKYSVHPGDEIKFYVNSENGLDYDAAIVRLIHGDTNPDGPGYKEEEIETTVTGTYAGRQQRIHGGSYICVPDSWSLRSLESFTLQVMVWSTTPTKRRQGLLTKWLESDGTGYGLFLNADGQACVEIGSGGGKRTALASGKPLEEKVWYLIAASFDAESGKLTLYQEPIPSYSNGGLGVSKVVSENSSATAEGKAAPPAENDAPITMAAYSAESDSGRVASGGHFSDLPAPVVLPLQSGLFNGKLDRPRVSRRALSRAEIESLVESYRTAPAVVRNSCVAAWDFHANMSSKGIPSQRVIDTSERHEDGVVINMPWRAVTGYNWTGDEIVFTHAPDEYGAIHFHDDDVDDCRWDVDFALTVPDELKSGVYAARVRIGEGDPDGYAVETEDYIPFFVRPPRGKKTADLALIIPTASYLAYANDNLSSNSVVAQLLAGKVPVMQMQDLYLAEHREYGLSTYSLHSDGHGVCYSSRLRPMLNMRPKYRHWLSPSLWQLNGDLHIVDWLETKGIEYDIHTDEDLDREGMDLLAKYKVVLTGSHPEYSSENMINAYEAYQAQGGRWMYLGANGFYWIVAYHPDNSNIIEVRKGEAGTRAWTANPGEYNNAFDGKFGGMWRARGRIPSKLCGLTFTAYGFDVSSYYRRMPDSERPEIAWMFEGIGKDEIIGDFGLVGGGAAGLELDRYDLDFGTPKHAYLVARSEGHTDLLLQVNEEIHFSVRGYYGGGDENPMVRADMIFYTTANGGAVWAPGALTWCGSLSHNAYDNNVSRLTENVVRRFLSDEPLLIK